MTVIRPNSISGITSITAQANEINVFKSDGTLAGLSLNGVNVNTTAGISTYAALNVTGNVSVGGTLTYQDVTNVDAVGLITARAGVNVSGGQLDVGSNIKLGNAGVITATSFVGSGANLTGLTVPGGGTGLDLNDNVKARFGTGNDLEIFHNGSSSVIRDGGSGALTIQNAASEVNMYNTTDNEYLAQFINGGACKLYYDGSRKFDTLTNGIQITGQQFISEGTITLEKSGVHHHRILSNDTGNDLAFQQSADNGSNTNFTTYLRINNGGNISLPVDNQKLRLGASADLQIFHNGSHSFIDNNTGDLNIESSNVYIKTNNTENAINCVANGTVELFYDNSRKLNTHTSGILVSGGLKFGASSGSDPEINNAEDTNELSFQTGGAYRLRIQDDGHTRPSSNNSYDLGTSSYRWRNVYSQDLQLSNEAKKDEGGNDVDGTWGDYTIQEGESELFLINNRNGKKYTFLLKEVT